MNTSTEHRRLEELGIDEQKLAAFQVICLPENIFATGPNEQLRDAGEVRHFAKLLQASNVRCATAFDFGLDIPILQRRSRDTRLGVIWIRDVLALPLIVGVLSSYFASEVHDKISDATQPKVHLELFIERGPNVTKISYSGDGATLVQILSNINTNTPAK